MNHEHHFVFGDAEPSALALLWQALKTTVSRLEHTVAEPINDTKPEHESKHSVWNAAHISKRASREGWRNLVVGNNWSSEKERGSKPYLNSALWHDARHHARENHLVELDTYYYNDLTLEGIFGGGYSTELITMTTAFTDILAKDGKYVSRGELETQVLTMVKSWAWQSAEEPGSYLLWTSPPDTEENGYPGIDSLSNWRRQESNHSFIYVIWAEKLTESVVRIHTRQLRGWPNIDQLITFQKSVLSEKNSFLATPLGEAWRQPSSKRVTLDLIENLLCVHAPTTPLETTLHAIKSKLYTSQKKWLVSPETLPNVDTDRFWEQQEALFASHYLESITPLLAQLPTGLSADDPYWASDEFDQILQQLDTAFTYYDLGLKDIVIETNTNDQYRAFHPNPFLNQVLGWGRSFFKLFGSKESLLEKIKRLYHLDVALRIQDMPLSKADAFWYLRNVSGLAMFSNALLSASQCGILTPFTLPFSAAKYAAEASTGGMGGANPFQLLSPEIRLELTNTLTQTEFAEVTIAGQIWTIPTDYLEETAWLEQTKTPVLGPCDIPLEADSLAFAMSLRTFESWRQLMIPLLAGTPALQKLVELLPNTKPEKILDIFDVLVTKVLKPVSLANFVSGTYDFTDELNNWVDEQYVQPLTTSSNPLATLELLISEHADAILADSVESQTLRARLQLAPTKTEAASPETDSLPQPLLENGLKLLAGPSSQQAPVFSQAA